MAPLSTDCIPFINISTKQSIYTDIFGENTLATRNKKGHGPLKKMNHPSLLYRDRHPLRKSTSKLLKIAATVQQIVANVGDWGRTNEVVGKQSTRKLTAILFLSLQCRVKLEKYICLLKSLMVWPTNRPQNMEGKSLEGYKNETTPSSKLLIMLWLRESTRVRAWQTLTVSILLHGKDLK